MTGGLLNPTPTCDICGEQDLGLGPRENHDDCMIQCEGCDNLLHPDTVELGVTYCPGCRVRGEAGR